jgi:TonB-linked SusC/RagA family outer membrane protein
MKKNSFENKKITNNRDFKILLTMKFIFILLFICVIQTFGTGILSQKAELKLAHKETSLQYILDEIEKQTSLRFLYHNETVENKIVNLDVKNKSWYEILEQIKEASDVNYSIMEDNLIVLTPVKKMQPLTIQGRVTNESGEPLIGVTIVVEGTTIGTITDNNGEYRIDVPSSESILVFSYVGYITNDVTVGNNTMIDVTMMPDITALEEIVVIGYGTQNSRNISSSVASVPGKSLEDFRGISTEQALSATVAGVNVVQTTGRPGGGFKINIRGINNLSGNDPLYVIDGVQFDAGYNHLQSPLTFLDPQDIESIQVLKDAAAASIYGSQGAGGVVIITTKKGIKGKADFKFDFNIGVQRPIGIPEMMDAETYAKAMIESRNNTYLRESPFNSISDPDSIRSNHRNRIGIFEAWQNGETEFKPIGFNLIYLDPEGVDWFDETFRDNPITSTYRLSATGGTENISYYISGSYRNEEGLIDGWSGFERYSFRVNLESKLNKRINVGLNLNPTFTHNENMLDEGRIHIAGIYTSSLVSSPITAVRRPDGLYQSNITGHVYGIQNNENPVLKAKEWRRYTDRYRTIGNTYVNIDILKGLSFNSSASVNMGNYKSLDFKPYTVGQWGTSGGTPDMDDYQKAQRRNKSNNGGEFLSWQIVEQLSYETSLFTNHYIKIMGAFEAIKNSTDSWYVGVQRYATDFFPNSITSEENIVDEGGVRFAANTNKTTSTSASFIGRLQYSYKNKYNITASIRRDGYSGFGPDNRWGVFPSVGLGWIVSDETFMETVPLISLLKVRFSTGRTGKKTDLYSWLTGVYPTNYVYGEEIISAFKLGNMNDFTLAWEQLQSTTFGVEAGILDNRVTFIAEYFNNNNSRFINDLDVPSVMGQNSFLTNYGELNSKGVEFTLFTRNFATSNFQWSTNINASYNTNKLTSFGLDPRAKEFSNITEVGNISHVTEQNAPISNFWLRPQNGIYATEEDLARYPIFVDKGGSKVGEKRFRDVNRDGIVTENEDRMVMGSPWPKWYFGMVNNLVFRDFELSFTMQGKLGNKIYDYSRDELTSPNTNMLQEVWDGRWQSPENPGDGTTGIIANNQVQGTGGSSYLLFDASYLAMRNVTLTYNLPLAVALKMKMQGMRIYGTIENAFFIKEYYGNPEAESSGDRASSTIYEVGTAGVNYGTYPLARTFMIGVSFTL